MISFSLFLTNKKGHSECLNRERELFSLKSVEISKGFHKLGIFSH